MLVLSVEEISEMLTGMGTLPDSEDEATEHVEGWVAHMRAGNFPCGLTIPDGLPASSRVGESRPQGALVLVLSVDEVTLLLLDLGSLPGSERDARQLTEAWVEQMRALEIPCGRTIDDHIPAELEGEL